MIYIVLTAYDSSTRVLYLGPDRTAATSAFTDTVNGSLVSITYVNSETFFAGFGNNTKAGKLLKQLSDRPIEDSEENIAWTEPEKAFIFSEFESAEYLFKFISNEHRVIQTTCCDNCGRSTVALLNKNTTIYGKNLCNSCWSSYIQSKLGLAEYFLAIATGKYSISAYTEQTLKKIGLYWNVSANILYNTGRLTSEQITGIEDAAIAAGFKEEYLTQGLPEDYMDFVQYGGNFRPLPDSWGDTSQENPDEGTEEPETTE